MSRSRPARGAPGPRRASSAQQRGGRPPGEARALARQVRLVRIAGVERGAGEVGVARGQEAPEAQHALERLRAVARGRVAAAPELAFAEAEIARERLDPRPRLLEPPR